MAATGRMKVGDTVYALRAFGSLDGPQYRRGNEFVIVSEQPAEEGYDASLTLRDPRGHTITGVERRAVSRTCPDLGAEPRNRYDREGRRYRVRW